MNNCAELFDTKYLQEVADEIWEEECQSDGDAGSATKRMVEYIADDLYTHMPFECSNKEEWFKILDALAEELVSYYIKNFKEYEEQSQGETALQEAELDIRHETMRSL